MSRDGLVLLVCAAVAGCAAQPRSASYFAAHLDEARVVVTDCRTGARRGAECDTAQAALAVAARDARLREFHKAF
jgi:hypothetical protein